MNEESEVEYGLYRCAQCKALVDEDDGVPRNKMGDEQCDRCKELYTFSLVPDDELPTERARREAEAQALRDEYKWRPELILEVRELRADLATAKAEIETLTAERDEARECAREWEEVLAGQFFRRAERKGGDDE